MTTLPVFRLEDYFEPREFKAELLFSSSDVESRSLGDLMALASPKRLEQWQQLGLGYTEVRGSVPLREKIAELYASPAITAQQVVTFAGAEEAIYALFQTLLDANDHAVVVTPCYQSLRTLPESRCSVTSVELRPSQQENRWVLPLDALREAVLSRPTKVMVLNFPHNPTGAHLTRQELDAVIALARQADCYLFLDEVYRGLELDGTEALPPVASLYEKGISLGVMSKAYGLAGLRVGWLATPDQAVLDAAMRYKYYLSICNSAPSEFLALVALEAGERILAENRQLIQENYRILSAFISDNPQWVRWTPPQAGCTGLLAFTGVTDIEVFADRVLDETGVMLLPATVYDYPGPYCRISYGRRTMPEALERIRRFLSR